MHSTPETLRRCGNHHRARPACARSCPPQCWPCCRTCRCAKVPASTSSLLRYPSARASRLRIGVAGAATALTNRPLTAGGPSRKPVSLGELSETMDKEETASGARKGALDDRECEV